MNNYRELNKHTIKDRTPLPLPDDILSTCSNAQFWAKIDMTNSFFQTKMAEEDIHKTAVSTPWGLYEWTVMPMGLCNAPATHQRRVNEALQGLLGTICFVYLDDITIFADTLEEHEARVRQVLDALRRAELYCSPTKTNLATAECSFLGHIINRAGVHADPKKIQRIEDWSLPKTVKELRGFLGLVQYLRKFIPGLAEHTAALTPLTRQGLSSIATLWTPNEVRHFKAIKAIVTSLDCLRPPDHSANAAPFWVMTDASNQGIGGVLLQGQEWKVARPIAYWSRQYIPAERNYPTHEQELLAIVEALKEWRIDLLGGHFHILTDHSTLEHFQTQRTVLSRRQARWLDTLAEFDYDLRYLPGEDNIVADAMSRYSFTDPLPTLVAAVSHVKLSDAVKQQILDAYETDPFCQQAMSNIGSVTSDFKIVDALLYLRGRLIIPSLAPLRESILHDAHDAQGHLGDMKTYRTVQQAYFWPNMSRDVKHYVQQCDSCQRTKARTTRIAGKLHSLPVPTRPMADIAIDFVGPLPANKGFDRVLTITDRLSGYVRLLPAREADTAAEVAARFHEGWHRLFGLPQSIVSDRDKLFTSKFWTALHKRLNIKLQLSSAFHPETDALVNKEQSNWAECLAVCEYAINSSLNVATGKTPFELVLGYTPSLTPLARVDGDDDLPSVEELLALRFQACEDARDQLAISKVRQAAQSNKKPQDEPSWAVGDLVLLDSSDRRKRLHTRKRRAAKLMDRFDGPYRIVKAQPEISSYTLQLNGDDAAVPFFHTGKLKTYRKNDTALFPNREPARLGPVDVGGEPEYIMEDIVDERIRAGKQQYLVSWLSWPSDSNSWEPAEALEDTEALDRWERRNEESPVRLESDLVPFTDIATSVRAVAKCVAAPTEGDWICVKRIFRYLSDTVDYGLLYRVGGSTKFEVYSDASFGCDHNNGRSVGAYVVIMAGAAISWKSKQQTMVASSTAESETLAASTAAKEAIGLRNLASELRINQGRSTVLHEDNQPCIDLAKNPGARGRTRHWNVHHFYLRERIEVGDIDLRYCPTDLNTADILTKPLSKLKFSTHREGPGMVSLATLAFRERAGLFFPRGCLLLVAFSSLALHCGPDFSVSCTLTYRKALLPRSHLPLGAESLDSLSELGLKMASRSCQPDERVQYPYYGPNRSGASHHLTTRRI
ncbi:BQ5605_C001g00666 [Microbotryum silenes-dioicae]|uniref:BQ5605_C001g00666 protein n=1 Tax=Microbotryum silenes-dioicae TaxID=796604 RepID=A0A2X0P6N3_9BASI|nr:BQ5605_C001g00666 [Microbotryum silenes-dioicae]